MDGAAHHHEQLQLQHDIEDALKKSTKEPLTADEATLLAWAAGVQLKQEAA